MSEKIREILNDLQRRFQNLYGQRLVKLILYGSQARGDAEPGSDIDVLAVLKGPVSDCEEIERTLDDTADLSLQFSEVISCVFVSEEEYEREHSPLMINVRREGVLL